MIGRQRVLGHLMRRRRGVIGSMIGRLGSVIGGLSREHFIRNPLGIAFFKFRHVQIMARNLEVTLAHIETGCSLGQMKILGGAIPISPRPHPESKFAHRIGSRQNATHKMQHRNTDCGEANGTRLSRSLTVPV